MKFIKRLFNKTDENDLPQPLPDARVYVAHGDNIWGHAISWEWDEDKPTYLSGWGWISGDPWPRVGDWMLKLMQGGWGYFIITNVEHAQGVGDMFRWEARGVVRYAEGDEIPKTKNCTEFVKSAYKDLGYV